MNEVERKSPNGLQLSPGRGQEAPGGRTRTLNYKYYYYMMARTLKRHMLHENRPPHADKLLRILYRGNFEQGGACHN